MSSILRGNDNLDSSNLATDTELSTALAGKANTIVANDSQIKTALNATGTAPIYACRAWVNFNGTGTVAIRASGNVSSITDNGAGNYIVNFTTAMIDADFSISGNCCALDSEVLVYNSNSVSSVYVSTLKPGVSIRDVSTVMVEVFR